MLALALTGITLGQVTRRAGHGSRTTPPGSPPGRIGEADEPSGFDETSTPPSGHEESARRTVQLNTLMLLIALFAVCLGVLHEVAGLGILLIILVIPALGRTFAGARRREALGRSMSGAEKTLAFLGSLVVVAVLGLAASIAFLATCLPTGIAISEAGHEGHGIIVGVLVGLVAVGFVLFYLGRRLWPQKDL